MSIRQNDHHLRMLGEILLQQGITGEILLTEQGVFMLDIRDGEVTKNISVYFGPGEALRSPNGPQTLISSLTNPGSSIPAGGCVPGN